MRQVSRPDGWASVAYRLEYPELVGRDAEAVARRPPQRMRSRASAYALYVLAKGGRGDLARLRWWHDVQMKTEASPLARAQVGAGLAMMGDRARARSAFRQAVRALGYKRRRPTGTRARCATSPASSPWPTRPARPSIAREPAGAAGGRGAATPTASTPRSRRACCRPPTACCAPPGRCASRPAGATAAAGAGGAPRWAVGRLADARFANAGSGRAVAHGDRARRAGRRARRRRRSGLSRQQAALHPAAAARSTRRALTPGRPGDRAASPAAPRRAARCRW